MSNVPVLEAVRAAFAFRRRHWRAVAPILGVVAVGSGLGFAGEATGDQALRSVGSIVNFVATIAAYGALFRLAFIDERPDDPELHPGSGGLQWGKPEWRLLGVVGLMFVVGLIAFCAFVLVGVIAFMILLSAGVVQPIAANATPEQIASALTPQAVMVIGFLFGVFAVAMAYLFSRLSLAMAATVSRGQVAVFQTWPLTKGQAWRIFAAVVLSNTPSIAAGILLAAGVSIMGGSAQAPQLALPAAVPLAVIGGLVAAFIQLPINIGLAAFLYRGLRPAGER